MSIKAEEREQRIARGICLICGEQPMQDGFKSCRDCRRRLSQAAIEREARKRHVAEMEREVAKREKEEAAKARRCEGCGYRKYAGGHIYTCPSAFGTCIKEEEKTARRAALEKQLEEERAALEDAEEPQSEIE